MSAQFSLSRRPSFSNPQPALFFIPLCFAAVTHLLGQQMEQGKHSMSVLLVHPQLLSLSLSISFLPLSPSFFFWKALELGIFLGLPLEQAEYTFSLSSLLSWDYNHIGFINPTEEETFPCCHCFWFVPLSVLKDHPQD